jgi:hypothetical protein
MKNEAQIMTIPYLLSILIAKRWWWMLEATITPICPKNFIYSTRFVATIVKAVILKKFFAVYENSLVDSQ